MKILTASVVSGRGPDTILLKTDLPSACYPFDGALDLKITAGAGMGADYVREHFGLEPEIILVPEPVVGSVDWAVGQAAKRADEQLTFLKRAAAGRYRRCPGR